MNAAVRNPNSPPSSVICPLSDHRWNGYVASLEATGFPLPAFAAASYPLTAATQRWLVGLREPEGGLAWGAIAESSRSRIVPWRRIIRFHRFGRGLTPAHREAALDVIVEFATIGNALRLHVSLYEPDAASRHALIQGLTRRRFRLAPYRESYRETVLIDLRESEEALLRSFHAKTRRDIRALGKAGLTCREITDPAFAPRMNALLAISMARTGGRFVPTIWDDVMRFIDREPSRAVLIGVFRTDSDGPESLVGYVLGYRHGDTLEYGLAACARLADIRAPLLYAPTWELMRWGKRQGAEWFDFGGVTPGSRASGDPAGGISDFKRYFRSDITSVGEELVFTPSPRLSHLATSVSTLATFFAERRAVFSR